ncbi:MAG: hypothetical protein HQL77_17595 [Magnetococcales bacterium]|nr:hypothetical protein [Magnetococcales bacterium]
MEHKLTPEEKAAKKLRREKFMTVFVGGKQKKIKRPLTIDGVDVDTWIQQNADPIWFVQDEMYEYLTSEPYHE